MTRSQRSASPAGASLAREFLVSFLRRVDVPSAGPITADEAARWPGGALECLLAKGLVREAAPAQEVECLECDEGCWIRPRIADDPRTGKPVGRYFCRQHGPFKVDLARLKQWEFDDAGAASAVAAAAKTTGPVQELCASRLYCLGTLALNGRPCQAFFARGVAWSDWPAIVARTPAFRGAASPLVFVPAQRPRLRLPSKGNPIVCPLTEIASLKRGKFKMDMSVHALTLKTGAKTAWLTVTEAAKLLERDLLGLELSKARARVSAAATRGEFTTNGEAGQARRIDSVSFDAWRLKQRDRSLDAEHDQDEA